MKKNPLNIAIAIIGLAISQVAIGQTAAPTPHSLVLTEHSSTNLTATFDNSAVPVYPTGLSDQWSLGVSGLTPLYPDAGWLEPDNFNEANLLFFFTDGTISVISDSTLDILPQLLAPNNITINSVFFDSNDQLPVDVTFNDLGDTVTTVPETGSTLALMCLSGIALFVASRLVGSSLPGENQKPAPHRRANLFL